MDQERKVYWTCIQECHLSSLAYCLFRAQDSPQTEGYRFWDSQASRLRCPEGQVGKYAQPCPSSRGGEKHLDSFFLVFFFLDPSFGLKVTTQGPGSGYGLGDSADIPLGSRPRHSSPWAAGAYQLQWSPTHPGLGSTLGLRTKLSPRCYEQCLNQRCLLASFPP